jgi:hypothetical protein
MEIEVCYQTLALEPGASQSEIQQAYKDLVRIWHPDRFSDDPRLQAKVEQQLKQINAAYEILKPHYTDTHRSQVITVSSQSSTKNFNLEKLKSLLEAKRLKDADSETKRLLLEFANREREGWLRPEDIDWLSAQSLLEIDRLWTQYSHGQFGFSVQKKLWHRLGCVSSGEMITQTISEKKFGTAVYWRTSSTWLSPWDAFAYDFHAPQGSLPRQYIFALSGWHSHAKGWTGYLLLRFDDVFLKI